VSDPIQVPTAQPYESALERACVLWGIQREYWDIFGKHHVAAPALQAQILSALKVPSATTAQLESAIEARLWADWSTPVAPTLVVSLSDGSVPVRIPADSGPLTAEFHWESGATSTVKLLPDPAAATETAQLRGHTFHRQLLPLPKDAAIGYHRLTLGGAESRLILCPDKAYTPEYLAQPFTKGAGIAISLYGLRSGRNHGVGDFTDLQHFSEWAHRVLGVSFVALNPLHSIPNRAPYNTSPYLPNCSFYRNGIYIDTERIPEIVNSPLAQRILAGDNFRRKTERLRATEYVEYEQVWSLKLKVLRLAWREFRRLPADAPRRRAFHAWATAEGSLLHQFAVYQAIDEILHKCDRNLWIWPDWPEPFRDPASPAVAGFESEYPRLIEFYKFIQWQIDEQLAAAQQYAKDLGMSIGLYHDLALATDRCGSDLWAHSDFYVAGCRVGSPPDDFSPKGQDWAFPPPNSLHHHETGYELFVQSIRKNSSHGGALRIDHVMRFFRLFWIPDGMEATEGLYVRDFSDDLVRILALESVRNKVIVIGEDLGTVEPYIRETLNKFGILSYRLLYFEKRPDGSLRRPWEYPESALVSVSTHDLPTLAGFWTGRDIDARRKAGLLPDEASYLDQLASRATDRQSMLDVMFELDLLQSWFPRKALALPEFTGELHNAAVGFLSTTPSRLMVLNQEDLFKDPDQQNLPGTTAQYPNWRHKMAYRVEDLDTDPRARGCALMYRAWLSRTGRLDV